MSAHVFEPIAWVKVRLIRWIVSLLIGLAFLVFGFWGIYDDSLSRMKMKCHTLGVLLLTGFLFLPSCNRGKESSEKEAEQSEEGEVAKGELTPWMSRAGLQHFLEIQTTRNHFARVEGRLFEGGNEYRAFVEELDTKLYGNSIPLWGLTEEELFAHELRLLRRGFKRHDSQVFTNSAGIALYQLVMVSAVDYSELGGGGSSGASAPAVQRPAPEVMALQPAEVAPAPEVTAESSHDLERGSAPDVMMNPEPDPVLVVETREYRVVGGDTLGGIAQKHGVSVSELKDLNGLRSDMIRLGQRLKIPVRQ